MSTLVAEQVCAVHGRHVTAEFLGAEMQKDKHKGDKVYPGKYLVKVLDGDAVMSIEYASREAAEGALPWLGAANRGDIVTVPFGVRSNQGYTFYFGRRLG